jgi:hypothetical protein
MTETVRDKLAAERALTDWRSLGPHHDRKAVFLVDQDLDLIDAAVAVAMDDSGSVAAWLASGRIARPTEDQAAAFAAAPDTPFVALIVQPFVLAAELPVRESP